LSPEHREYDELLKAILVAGDDEIPRIHDLRRPSQATDC
jgi:hypothetical protein